MKTREEALNYGLSFKNTYIESPFHDPNWQLVRIKGNKKAFLWTYERDGYINLNVKVDPDSRDFWRRAYEAVIPGWHQNKEHWNTIILDGSIPDDDIKLMIEQSYNIIADNASMRIYDAVKKIPKGQVATYGQVAELAGDKKMARAVGNALHHNPDPKHIPCHRVVNSKGELSGAFAFGGEKEQENRLTGEGVLVENGRVDLKKYGIKLFDAVVFDMDGVIFDSERATFNCWMEIAAKHGIPHIEKPYYACIGRTKAVTKEIMLKEYGDDFAYDIYEREVSILFHSKYDGGKLPMKKGIKPLLAALKKNGKKIALASSTRSQTVINHLKEAEIYDYFDAVICGDMVQRSKPAPDIFMKACDELNVAYEKAYAIEDSYNGIRSASAGNLKPIMVPDMLPATKEMEKLSEVVLADLTQVKAYLKL